MSRGLAFNLIDYLGLVDWTGRVIRDDERGSISEYASPILQRLNISPAHRIEITTSFEGQYRRIVGTVESVKKRCSHRGPKRTVNRSYRQILYNYPEIWLCPLSRISGAGRFFPVRSLGNLSLITAQSPLI